MDWKTLSRNKACKFTLFLAILVACWYFGRIFKVDVPYYQDLLSNYPVVISGLIFVLLYVGTTTFIWLGPKDVLRISSAIFFGAFVSTVFVWIGEMINARIMFHLSRILGRDYVQQRLGKKGEKLDQMKDDTSILGCLAWRINPLVPFRLMDLGFGLSKISFRKYCLSIVVITFLRIYWLQYILAGVGELMFKDPSLAIKRLQENPNAILISLYFFLAVVIVTITATVARFIRKRKNKAYGTTQR